MSVRHYLLPHDLRSALALAFYALDLLLRLFRYCIKDITLTCVGDMTIGYSRASFPGVSFNDACRLEGAPGETTAREDTTRLAARPVVTRVEWSDDKMDDAKLAIGSLVS